MAALVLSSSSNDDDESGIKSERRPIRLARSRRAKEELIAFNGPAAVGAISLPVVGRPVGRLTAARTILGRA